MKIVRVFLSVILISILFYSCKKDNNGQDSKDGILLEINPASNCYIDQNDNHFYANVFSGMEDADQYRIAVKKGIKYRILCTQPNVDNATIEMVLLNYNRDTITYSHNYRGTPKIFFNSSSDNQLYLSVFPSGTYHESLDYRLYFEVADPTPVSFIDMNCDYNGYWQVEDPGTLKFTNIDARTFRWFRFNWSFQNNPGISFTLKSPTKTELPSFGFVFNGSAELLQWSEYKEELPEHSTFFNIVGNEDFKLMYFYDYSIGFDYGNIDPYNIDLLNGVDITINYDNNSYSIYLNNAFLYNRSSAFMNRFYLVVEDLGYDEFIFENFKIE